MNYKQEKAAHKRGETKQILKERLKNYDKGSGVEIKNLKKGLTKHKIKKKEKNYVYAQTTAARAEILLTEPSGLLETEESVHTSTITQRQIKNAVDISAATKSFDLTLKDFGPYKMRYSDNGRHLVLGGRKGHLCAIDWLTKNLHCEINVTESIHDVCFLHAENMMAAAQKRWTYIYDKQGVELHCLKKLYNVFKLEFLPYHFLLCSLSSSHNLSWLDITLGEEIIQTNIYKHGIARTMCQNPANAVISCGHNKGTVTMWTPNVKDPVFSMLCHGSAIESLAFDQTGRVFATTGTDTLLRLWDLRNLGKNVSSFQLRSAGRNVCFSQTNLLALLKDDVVEIYKNVTSQDDCEIYMKHTAKSGVTGMQFCPFEDVLGVAERSHFESLLIPGSGEANFDALEANPLRSSRARRETEVKRLLEKIPAEMITMDTNSISQIDVPTAQEKLEAKKALKWVKVPKIDLKPRYRMKGKSGSAMKFKRKMKMKEDEKREFIKFIKEKKHQEEQEEKQKTEENVKPPAILDRFKPKIKPKK